MSQFKVVAITVSCEIADKTYGNGESRMVSMTARVPEGSEGALIDDAVLTDAVDLYFLSWQSALQTRLAEGAMKSDDFKLQTARFLERLSKVKQVYDDIKGQTPEELKELIASLKAKKE